MCLYWESDMNPLNTEQIVTTLFAHRGRLSAAIWLIVRDVHLAEDVFQEVAIKASSQTELFQNASHLLSWSHVTARNAALNLLRSRKKHGASLDESILEQLEAEWANDGSTVDQRIDALQECLAALPQESRDALTLRYAEGRTCQEVAACLGLKLDATYQRISRLHLALRQCVERKFFNANPSNA
jgi:RNA polymerase sigma-70 factor, ECF subfamily